MATEEKEVPPKKWLEARGRGMKDERLTQKKRGGLQQNLKEKKLFPLAEPLT